jgi:glycosyltransferase involved in cell wall biosynthesis
MAHIIMAYKDPAQIERLVKRLSHPDFDFYIHLDTKFDLAPFAYLGNIERVYFIKNRVKVRWAGFSFTEGVLNSIQEIRESGREYDFINNMSGQDYPLVTTSAFYSFFEERKGKSFFAIEEFGTTWWERAKVRIHKYHMTDFDFKGRYKVQAIINAITPQRKFPYGYTLYGGERATWWTMSVECADYLLQFMREHPDLKRFARYTWAPDEFLLPTLVMNSPLKDKVVHENYRYIDWSQGGSNPKILTVKDFDALTHTDKLLARKFDYKVDTQILDMLDEAVGS